MKITVKNGSTGSKKASNMVEFSILLAWRKFLGAWCK
jgi:hypothetical protein